jgi:hypothetical protein
VEGGLEFDITLSVGGMLISGVMISSSEYFKLFGDQMRARTVPELQDEMTRAFTSLAESAQNAVREREREEEIWQSLGEAPEDVFMPRYIHLKETKIFLAAGAGIPN